jgi:hypothetical protein
MAWRIALGFTEFSSGYLWIGVRIGDAIAACGPGSAAGGQGATGPNVGKTPGVIH